MALHKPLRPANEEEAGSTAHDWMDMHGLLLLRGPATGCVGL